MSEVDHAFVGIRGIFRCVQPLITVPVNLAAPVSERQLPRIAAQRVQVADGASARISWWLWPHLMSFDAPLVAVVWQWWWARALHVKLSWPEPWILGSGVWLIYLADRLADARRAVSGDPITPRHAFHARRRAALSILTLMTVTTLALTTPFLLSRSEFLHGLGLLSLAGAYFWLIHSEGQRGWAKYLPKEMAVGGIFAIGTAFFPLSRSLISQPWVTAGIGLFGGVCFCNCALITVWERHAQDVRDRTSLLNAFPHLCLRLRRVCLVLACIASCGLFSGTPRVFLPLILSGLLLAALDQWREKLSPDLLRVLADVALLTPILVGYFTIYRGNLRLITP